MFLPVWPLCMRGGVGNWFQATGILTLQCLNAHGEDSGLTTHSTCSWVTHVREQREEISRHERKERKITAGSLMSNSGDTIFLGLLWRGIEAIGVLTSHLTESKKRKLALGSEIVLRRIRFCPFLSKFILQQILALLLLIIGQKPAQGTYRVPYIWLCS